VNDLDGVYLYDIDSLQRIADESMAVRRQELVICEEMIERHVEQFIAGLGPTFPHHARVSRANPRAKS
jgi:glutamyl-tRNA reductase